jgi:hypothetical protein
MTARVLVFGDSYANFNRFGPGIEAAFWEAGIAASVYSVSRPGFHCGMLLAAIRSAEVRDGIAAAGPFDLTLIVGGVNDIVQRRGADAYRRSMVDLVGECSAFAKHVFALELIHFDEYAELSSLAGRLKHRFHAALRDRRGDRVERYRQALADEPSIRLVETRSFLSVYDRSRFKDGIHLADTEFHRLASHAGRQLVKEFCCV